METADANDNRYDDYIRPCHIDLDGLWTSTRGHQTTIVGAVFDTPEGTEWDKETIHAVTKAIDYVECCPLCEEWVANQTPLLHTAGHRILPCCACDQFVWLVRPDFEESVKEALA